jgi:hypothetical protein
MANSVMAEEEIVHQKKFTIFLILSLMFNEFMRFSYLTPKAFEFAEFF